MSGKKNDNGSCGVFLIFAIIIGSIVELIKENYTLLIITAAVIVLAGVIWVISKKESEYSSNDNNIVIPDIRRDENNYRIFIEGDALTSGQYLGGRDIEAGIYNIRVLKGDGTISVEGKNNFKNRFKEGQTFNNIEIPEDAILKIDMGMRVDFFDRRDLQELEPEPEPVPILETAKEVESVSNEDDTRMPNNMTPTEDGVYINIDEIEGHDFEYFCADLLTKQGFDNVQVTKGSGDQGVDILAERNMVKYAIQCKRYSQPVGNKAVQEINAGRLFYNCNAAIVITNNSFTPSAIELSEKLGVTLWDGKFMKENLIGNINGIKVKDKPFTNIYPGSGSKVYPPGVYQVGTSIEPGGYIIKCRDESAKAEVWRYFEEYDEGESPIICAMPRGEDYFITLQYGQYMVLSNADMIKY